MLFQLCLYFLLHLSPFGQFEEGVGRVEEASLEEEDKGNPLVVGLVLNLQKYETHWVKYSYGIVVVLVSSNARVDDVLEVVW